MAKLLKVIRVELRETITEIVQKSKRHDYVRGGYKIDETVRRVKSATHFALLECGHWRQDYNYGPIISKAKRLSCHRCELEKFEKLSNNETGE